LASVAIKAADATVLAIVQMLSTVDVVIAGTGAALTILLNVYSSTLPTVVI
jgi:hypothetical protein